MPGELVGTGTGIIIVPSFIYYFRMSQFTAQGTSLGMVYYRYSFTNFKGGYVDLKIAGILAIWFLAGSYFESKLVLSF